MYSEWGASLTLTFRCCRLHKTWIFAKALSRVVLSKNTVLNATVVKYVNDNVWRVSVEKLFRLLLAMIGWLSFSAESVLAQPTCKTVLWTKLSVTHETLKIHSDIHRAYQRKAKPRLLISYFENTIILQGNECSP